MTHPGLAVMLVVGVGLGAVLYYFFASTPEQVPTSNRRRRNNSRPNNNRPYWTPQANDSRNRRQDQKSCRICLEDTNKDNAVRLVPCMHIFDKKCIEEWRVNGAGEARHCCPICRDKIVDLEAL